MSSLHFTVPALTALALLALGCTFADGTPQRPHAPCGHQCTDQIDEGTFQLLDANNLVVAEIWAGHGDASGLRQEYWVKKASFPANGRLTLNQTGGASSCAEWRKPLCARPTTDRYYQTKASAETFSCAEQQMRSMPGEVPFLTPGRYVLSSPSGPQIGEIYVDDQREYWAVSKLVTGVGNVLSPEAGGVQTFSSFMQSLCPGGTAVSWAQVWAHPGYTVFPTQQDFCDARCE